MYCGTSLNGEGKVLCPSPRVSKGEIRNVRISPLLTRAWARSYIDLGEQAGLNVFWLETFRVPDKGLQVAFSRGIKLDALGFENFLLQVHRDGQAAGGAFALRIDDTLPGNVVAGSVHDVADRASGVAFAEDRGNLTVGHYAAGRDLPDYLVHAFAVVFVVRRVHRKSSI